MEEARHLSLCGPEGRRGWPGNYWLSQAIIRNYGYHRKRFVVRDRWFPRRSWFDHNYRTTNPYSCKVKTYHDIRLGRYPQPPKGPM